MAAASLDSEASFKERAQKIGITPEVLQELAEAGYTTFGRLCFAVTANPTQLEDSAVDSWIRSIFREAPTPYQTSCLRRLLFEANSLNIADLHARVEPPAENIVRRLPAAERAARAQAQQARLAGVVFTPDTTPANSLVDLFVDQLESDILQYIGPERCVSRSQEMMSVKKDKTLNVDRYLCLLKSVLHFISSSRLIPCFIHLATKLLERRGVSQKIVLVMQLTCHFFFSTLLLGILR